MWCTWANDDLYWTVTTKAHTMKYWKGSTFKIKEKKSEIKYYMFLTTETRPVTKTQKCCVKTTTPQAKQNACWEIITESSDNPPAVESSRNDNARTPITCQRPLSHTDINNCWRFHIAPNKIVACYMQMRTTGLYLHLVKQSTLSRTFWAPICHWYISVTLPLPYHPGSSWGWASQGNHLSLGNISPIPWSTATHGFLRL